MISLSLPDEIHIYNLPSLWTDKDEVALIILRIRNCYKQEYSRDSVSALVLYFAELNDMITPAYKST